MKQLYYLREGSRHLPAIGIALLVVMLIACSDMNDLHQEYLDRGEVIYAAKADSVAPHSGRNRVEFEVFVKSQRITTARFFWNDYKDSSDLIIEGQGVFRKMLDNLEERRYIFQLVCLDEFGNRSLPVELSANVYGEQYQAQLVNRSVGSTSIDVQGKVTINWGSAVDGAVAIEVSYTDLAGNSKLQSFPADLPTSVITDLKPDMGYEYRTVYKPDSTGIDSFFTDYSQSTLLTFDKKDWSIVDFSSEHGGADNSVKNFIDGTFKTRWHSLAGSSSYPHHATIDLGIVRTITQFGAWITTFDSPPDGDHRAPDKIKFLVSMDNTTWTDLGEVNFNRFLLGEQTFVVSPPMQGRYFRFVGVSGPENNMVMGEVSAYGF
ncbi:DUF4998 domain-containing protein [Parachryseolinea silvisoli]|uniref:DUF4998 domain-containing protein n=1 Tax=Parachryseolinea silvisoli TaxID=2873601 RepID=UPI0022658551|nr:DUF4998 domain-containing protein [Parachryseolinea silvisoli]MCD9014849.1 discoidin domain-containing protein [Parachryseolinea silvisoli]